MLKALAVALTLWLKLTTTFELTATLVAPFAGDVLLTLGAVSPGGMPFAVTEKSSIAKPWSLSGGVMSTHRSQTSCPWAIVRESVADFWTRLAAAFPSSVTAKVVPNVGL